MIGINADPEGMEDFNTQLAESPVNWRQGMIGDGDHPIYADYDIPGYPTKVVIDKEGNVAAIDPDNKAACIESLL